MAYLIFDSETQIHKSHKRTANPFHPKNYVVMRGWKKQGDPHCTSQRFEMYDEQNWLGIPEDVDVLVGFNIKFDLLYEMQAGNPDLIAFYKRGGRIWCCQYAEYLLQAQARKYHMCSLDQIIEDYGGRKKIDGMKELWKAGVQTADIDPELVKDYLIGTEAEGRNSGDIGNTELIYRGQVQAAHELGMTAAILARMDGLAATTEMEFNGIHVNMERARKDLMALSLKRATAQSDLEQHVTHIPDEVGFSWTSRVHTSCLVFGGRIKYQKAATYIDPETGVNARLRSMIKWPLFSGETRDTAGCVWSESKQLWAMKNLIQPCEGVHWDPYIAQDTYVSGKRKGEGKFKNVKSWGEEKVKIQDHFYDLPGYTEGRKEWETANLDGNGLPTYSTGKEVMDVITKLNIPFLKTMGRFQSYTKMISTYYVVQEDPEKPAKGMLTCVGKDHIVHHMLNHNTTVTTRLASSNPNAQNIPRGDKSEVKGMFTSRFKDGIMGEIDYSQLEVIVQGWLSGDKNMCDDIRNGIDFHCKRVAAKNDLDYEVALRWCKEDGDSPDYEKWKKERTKCKIFSFQRAYGAGAATIADETGLTVDAVKEMILAEDKEYPGVAAFNAKVMKAVTESSVFFRDGERGYRPFRKGQWQCPTGTIYEWRSWDSPKFLRDKGVMDSFSPPELMNYPVQGTGGELVQLALGVLWRWFVANDNFNDRAFLVNTVHDCVWFDMQPDMVDIVMPGAMKIMSALPTWISTTYGLECNVPFPVDAETGINMLDLHHYNHPTS